MERGIRRDDETALTRRSGVSYKQISSLVASTVWYQIYVCVQSTRSRSRARDGESEAKRVDETHSSSFAANAMALK